jgi:hypothetical protein
MMKRRIFRPHELPFACTARVMLAGSALVTTPDRRASRRKARFPPELEIQIVAGSGGMAIQRARPRAWKLLLGVGRGSRKLSHPRRPSAQDCGWSGVAPTERRSDESLFHASERGHLYETLTGNFLTSDGRKFSILRHVAEDRIGEAGATRSMSGAVNQ